MKKFTSLQLLSMHLDGSLVGYKKELLPESEWHRCITCHGTGEYELRDLHKYDGTVKCSCDNGVTKYWDKPIIRKKCSSVRTYKSINEVRKQIRKKLNGS